MHTQIHNMPLFQKKKKKNHNMPECYFVIGVFKFTFSINTLILCINVIILSQIDTQIYCKIEYGFGCVYMWIKM